MSFGRPGGALDSFRVLPPDRGSFPLDHDGECKEFMMGYLKCLKLNGGNNGECRMETKKYLSCRMDNNLMTRDDMSNIGLGDLVDDSHTTLRPDPFITNVNVNASANANANANVKTTNTTIPTPPTTQERI